jgi:putative toxin-antitoxin system antitoxin component (TIGR02293 family)
MSSKRSSPSNRTPPGGKFVPASTARRTTQVERIPNPGRGDTPTRVIGQKLGSTGAVVSHVALGSMRISADEVRQGLPMRALDDLASQLHLDRAELADILGTSLRTLQRKDETRDRLGPVASDRLARVARILDLAVHVFGELDKASIWLTSKSRALEDEVPLHMLDTDIGTERVQRELRQIEFGMPF